MERVMKRKDIVYESRQSGSTSMLLARFEGGYTIWFQCSPENDIRATLSGLLDDKIEDEQQRSVAAKCLAKVGGGYMHIPQARKARASKAPVARKSLNRFAWRRRLRLGDLTLPVCVPLLLTRVCPSERLFICL